ncbi:helix-turn-helix transcriptional regulator [Herbaspirillum sp. WKF16]|uniref:helix-turn-helix domain-containing protein n=1 Tax=Herbaspirillum sp. WKF16 TaxID=3028312 RepID=UPI0023A98557|nr:helix-turn-helix transcriptional regulator [Herbaspirillum sp. WKF16]WDZ97954.1 helix-turn-helix transcriptional regulator [Herbaspirillum sp. WKF16]
MNDRIRKALEQKNGGNQSELARYAEVSPQAVQKWIAGASEPRGENLRKTAEFLGLTEVFLRYGAVDGSEPAAPIQPIQRWPFKVAYQMYALLPPDEKERLDDDVTHFIERWHAKNPAKSKKTG